MISVRMDLAVTTNVSSYLNILNNIIWYSHFKICTNKWHDTETVYILKIKHHMYLLWTKLLLTLVIHPDIALLLALKKKTIKVWWRQWCDVRKNNKFPRARAYQPTSEVNKSKVNLERKAWYRITYKMD